MKYINPKNSSLILMRSMIWRHKKTLLGGEIIGLTKFTAPNEAAN